ALHGSMRVKGIGAAEGDILKRVRTICPDIPIVVSLDMHATMTAEMLENADAFIGYKCAPHTDAYDTGCAAARLLLKLLSGTECQMSAVRIPFLIAGEKSETSTEPMKSVMEMVRKCEKKEGILSASMLMGFPWADTEDAGVTSLVISSVSKDNALRHALKNAEYLWSRRGDFRFCTEALSPEESLEKAKKYITEGRTPVILSDSGDNPTAGASGDVTSFLRLMLNDDTISHLDPPAVYQAVYDPETAAECFKAGVGKRIKGRLGGKVDPSVSTPIEFEGTVAALCDSYGETHSGTALIKTCGIDVIVTEDHIGCYEPEMMECLGINPEDALVITVKLGYLEPELKELASQSILVLTEGATYEVLEKVKYEKVKRPIYPLDKDFDSVTEVLL
ncbi:MAG: M81 family metallopeptidase, partial [Bullifex sp.]